MATTVRGTGWGGASTNTSQLLTAYINGKLDVLEPELKYAQLGLRRDVPKGFDRLLFPQTNQLPVRINTSMVTVGGPGGFAGGGSVWGAGASIQGGAAATAPGFPVSSTEGVAAITEGTNPSSVTWGATAYSSGPAQYGILVAVSDLLVRNSAIEVVDDATMQVRNALARLVDTVLQTVVNAGTNGVLYAGGKTSRSNLAAGDTAVQQDIVRGTTWLRASNAAGLKPFEGSYYVGVISPNAMGDLMSNTASGSWVDMARYSSVEDVKKGQMGNFRGVRFLEYPYQNYYNSTVAVTPITLLGERSFGWGYFQQPEAILVTTADSNNPLNLYKSIAGKVTLGATRFEDAVGYIRIVRYEAAFTS
jgi:N4-gp56 family major capsid protein